MAIEARIRELGLRHQSLERAIEDELGRPAADSGNLGLSGQGRASGANYVSPLDRTIKSASRASVAIIRPLTKIRIVFAAKCSGCANWS